MEIAQGHRCCGRQRSDTFL